MLRNKEGEIGILVSGFLEHSVQCLLHLFPYGVTVRANDHAAFNWRIICQFRGGNHVGVPSGVVFAALRNLRFGHNLRIIACPEGGQEPGAGGAKECGPACERWATCVVETEPAPEGRKTNRDRSFAPAGALRLDVNVAPALTRRAPFFRASGAG